MRYVARHGKGWVAKAVLISSIPPTFIKSEKNPDGVPKEVVDGLRDGIANHRSQLYKDITMPFYGFNRPGAIVSEGIRDNWWRQGMMGGIKAHYDFIKALSETEFYDDLKMIDVPVLVMHGEDDQICPFLTTGARSVKLLKHGTLKSYPGFPHGMPTTNADQINADLLDFIRTKHVTAEDRREVAVIRRHDTRYHSSGCSPGHRHHVAESAPAEARKAAVLKGS